MNPDFTPIQGYAPDAPRLKRLEPSPNAPPVSVNKGIRIRVAMTKHRPVTQTKRYPRKSRKRQAGRDYRDVTYF